MEDEPQSGLDSPPPEPDDVQPGLAGAQPDAGNLQLRPRDSQPNPASGDPWARFFVGLGLVLAGITLTTQDIVITRSLWAGSLFAVSGVLLLVSLVFRWRAARQRTRANDRHRR